jgi:hypothetical protein
VICGFVTSDLLFVICGFVTSDLLFVDNSTAVGQYLDSVLNAVEVNVVPSANATFCIAQESEH